MLGGILGLGYFGWVQRESTGKEGEKELCGGEVKRFDPQKKKKKRGKRPNNRDLVCDQTQTKRGGEGNGWSGIQKKEQMLRGGGIRRSAIQNQPTESLTISQWTRDSLKDLHKSLYGSA